MPFFLFIATLALSSAFDLRWLVIARGGIVALALLWFWPQYSELQHPSPTHFGYWLLAAFAGFAVFLAWIWLDRDWMMLGHAAGFDPRLQNGMAGWSHALARLAGLALVVPVMEELFWRSFLLRWLQHNQFLSVDPRQTHWTTSFATAMVFGLEHNQWLAGLLAGLVYNGLYTRSRDLRVPILAHAVTNGVLGLWILTTGSWQFW